MSSGPTGQLCRDLVGGSLTIKGRSVLDEHVNLKARGGTINGTLTVNEDVTVCGNVIVKDVVQSGAKAPVLLTGNTYTMSTDDTTLIIPNMYCFDKISDFTTRQGFYTTIARSTGDTVAYSFQGPPYDVRVYTYQTGTTWVQKGASILPNVYIRGISLSGDGNTILISCVPYSLVYDWNGSSWIQRGGNITIAGVITNNYLGQQTWITDDGNSFAVCDSFSSINFTNDGMIRVFEWNGSAWVQKGSTMSGGAVAYNFGVAVHLTNDGNTVAATGPYIFGSGLLPPYAYARVYSWNGSDWVQKGAEIQKPIPYTDGLGGSVTMSEDGNTVGFVTNRTSPDGGASFVYDWNGSDWVQRGSEIYETNYPETMSMSYDGNRIVIGGYGLTSPYSKQPKIYDWDGSAWILKYQISSVPYKTDIRGLAMTGDGTRVSVGYLNRISGTGPFPDGVDAEVYCIADTTVSLEFPDASACPGQELNINSENNFVYSTENNILHLYDFNTTRNEVMGNLDTFAILQSDGENWIRIFNKLPNFG